MVEMYLVNQLLNVHKSILFLESDVGQSEFTAPGILALNILSIMILFFGCY